MRWWDRQYEKALDSSENALAEADKWVYRTQWLAITGLLLTLSLVAAMEYPELEEYVPGSYLIIGASAFFTLSIITAYIGHRNHQEYKRGQDITVDIAARDNKKRKY